MFSTLIAAALLCQASPSMVEQYDKFDDVLTTTLFISRVPIASARKGTLDVLFHRDTPGKDRATSTADDRAWLQVQALNPSLRYSANRDVAVLVDGRKVALANPGYRMKTEDVGTFENIHNELTMADVLRIARAKSVEVRVGLDEFSLDEPARKSIERWATRLMASKADQDSAWERDKAEAARAEAERKAKDEKTEALIRKTLADAEKGDEVWAEFQGAMAKLFKSTKGAKARSDGRAKILAGLAKKYDMSPEFVETLINKVNERKQKEAEGNIP